LAQIGTAAPATEQIFRGPLNRLIGDALRHLRSTVLREHVVKHGDRAEADRFFNYQFATLEKERQTKRSAEYATFSPYPQFCRHLCTEQRRLTQARSVLPSSSDQTSQPFWAR